ALRRRRRLRRRLRLRGGSRLRGRRRSGFRSRRRVRCPERQRRERLERRVLRTTTGIRVHTPPTRSLTQLLDLRQRQLRLERTVRAQLDRTSRIPTDRRHVPSQNGPLRVTSDTRRRRSALRRLPRLSEPTER